MRILQRANLNNSQYVAGVENSSSCSQTKYTRCLWKIVSRSSNLSKSFFVQIIRKVQKDVLWVCCPFLSSTFSNLITPKCILPRRPCPVLALSFPSPCRGLPVQSTEHTVGQLADVNSPTWIGAACHYATVSFASGFPLSLASVASWQEPRRPGTPLKLARERLVSPGSLSLSR